MLIPTFKIDNRTSCNNYPISLLSQISKIIEKLIHTQLTKFLKQDNILHKWEFDF